MPLSNKPTSDSQETLQPEIPFNPDQELTPITQPNAGQFGTLKRRGMVDVLGTYLKNDKLAFLREYTADGWSALLDTLLDPMIVKSTNASGGHRHALERISNTLGFLLVASFFGIKSKKMEAAIRRLNLQHADAGILDKHTFKVTEKYENSFLYVLAVIIERIRDGLEKRNIPRDSKKGIAIAWDLCKVWYQLGEKIGATRMPKNLEAHDHFVRSHEQKIRSEMPQDHQAQEMAKEQAKVALPAIAATAGLTVEKLLRHVRPDVKKLLGLDDRDVQIQAQEESNTMNKEKFSVTQYLRTAARMLTHAMLGKPEYLRVLEQADEELEKANDPNWRLVYSILRYLGEHPPKEPPKTMTIGKKSEGRAIINEGTRPDVMYVVLPEPRSHLTVEQRENGQIATVDAASLIGEFNMTEEIPATATVRMGKGQVRLVEITRELYDKLCEYPLFNKAITSLKQKRKKDNETLNGNGHASASASSVA